MRVEVRVLVRVSSDDIDRHRGNIVDAVAENLEYADIDENSLEGENLTWVYESGQEYTEADTPGTPLYRFHRGLAWDGSEEEAEIGEKT